MSQQDFRNNIPNGWGRGLSEKEAAQEYLASGRASKHEACEIMKRWPGIRPRDYEAHEQRKQEYHQQHTGPDVAYDQYTHQVSQPAPRYGGGRLTRISREESLSRQMQRENERRMADVRSEREQAARELAERQEQAAREWDARRTAAKLEREQAYQVAIQEQRDGIRRTRDGRPVYADPQLTEGESIEIKMPGESVFSRIFTALVGSRK